MTFEACLQYYMALLNLNGKQLADYSGLSASAISRYRRGERSFRENSAAFNELINGLERAALERGVDLDMERVRLEMYNSLTGIEVSHEVFLDNLNYLLNALEITNKHLSRAVNFDASYISLIRRGIRRPANMREFIYDISAYISRRMPEHPNMLSKVLNVPESALASEKQIQDAVTEFLCSNHTEQEKPIMMLLSSLERFDPDEFVKGGYGLPDTQLKKCDQGKYHDVESLKAVQLDFMARASTSSLKSPIYMINEMPIDFLASDRQFTMLFTGMLIRLLASGHTVRVIHRTDRPLKEMLIGLEGWIPMYMTGNVSSYYLPHGHSGSFSHMLFAAENAAITAVAPVDSKEKFILDYSVEEDARSAYLMAANLFKNAKPLMKVFDESRERAFFRYMDALNKGAGKWMILYGSLPIYTLSEDLLDELLKSDNVSEDDSEKMREYRKLSLERISDAAKKGEVTICIPCVTREEFESGSHQISLSGMFTTKPLSCTWQQYEEHLALTKAFVASQDGFKIKYISQPVFRNIDIIVKEGKSAIVSKKKGRPVHFCIDEPHLTAALNVFCNTAASAKP